MNTFFTSLVRLVVGTTLVLATSLTLPALAQPASGGPVPGSLAPTSTPIDGGVSLLLAGGVALGLKQLRARRQARRTVK